MATVTLTPDQLPGLTVTFPSAGTFQIPVTVDGLGGSVTKTMTITVAQAAPLPTLTVEDAAGAPGEPIPLVIIPGGATSITFVLPQGAVLSTQTVVPPATDSIQGMLNAAGVNGTVAIPAGTYLGQTFLPRDHQTILADGVVMDGQGTTVKAVSPGTVTDVHITGLTVKNYNSPLRAGGGAIDGHGHTNWTLTNVGVIANLGQGMHLGAGWTLNGGLYADNGTIAIGGGDGGSIVIDGIECRNNCTTRPPIGGESGGMKIWNSSATVRNSCIWGNWGPGIWTDGDDRLPFAGGNHVIEDNTIFDNKASGIQMELQVGGVVRGNTVTRNGLQGVWGFNEGIVIQNSNGFIVSNNTVESGVNQYGDVGGGIFTVQQDRGVLTFDNEFFGNTIIFTAPSGAAENGGRNGTVRDFVSPDFDPYLSQNWHDNTYVRPNETRAWYAWQTGWRDFGFVQADGSEVGSTLTIEQRSPTAVACP